MFGLYASMIRVKSGDAAPRSSTSTTGTKEDDQGANSITYVRNLGPRWRILIENIEHE